MIEMEIRDLVKFEMDIWGALKIVSKQDKKH
jgi:hypothetical protein